MHSTVFNYFFARQFASNRQVIPKGMQEYENCKMHIILKDLVSKVIILLKYWQKFIMQILLSTIFNSGTKKTYLKPWMVCISYCLLHRDRCIFGFGGWFKVIEIHFGISLRPISEHCACDAALLFVALASVALSILPLALLSGSIFLLSPICDIGWNKRQSQRSKKWGNTRPRN